MDLYLGVDGGQSTTTAVVGDREGNVLGTGRGGPCNHARQDEGRAKLERGLTDAIDQALSPLQLTLADAKFVAVCIGMSGGPDDKRKIIHRLIRADSYDVTTDAHIALYGAVGDRAGAIVIAGTGSIALSRGTTGQIWRAGGWGYVFGDEGSGFDIARQALRASLQSEEGWAPETSMRAALLSATGASNANELLHRWYGGEFSRNQTATWSQLVDAAAAQGDEAAHSILDRAGKDLARLAAAAVKMASIKQGNAVICPVGGVFGSRHISASFASALEDTVSVAPTNAEAVPEIGALRAATRGVLLGSA